MSANPLRDTANVVSGACVTWASLARAKTSGDPNPVAKSHPGVHVVAYLRGP